MAKKINIQEIETQETELYAQLAELADIIYRKRHSIAEEVKTRLAYIQDGEQDGYNEVELPDTDIYNTEDILSKAQQPQQPGKTLSEIKYLCKVYVTTPFANEQLAGRVIAVLEELEKLETQITEYYEDKINKARAEVLKAQNRLAIAEKEYRVKTSEAKDILSPLANALSKDELGSSILMRAGVFTPVHFSPWDLAYYNAPEKISAYIRAIKRSAKDYRERKEKSKSRGNTPVKTSKPFANGNTAGGNYYGSIDGKQRKESLPPRSLWNV